MTPETLRRLDEYIAGMDATDARLTQSFDDMNEKLDKLVKEADQITLLCVVVMMCNCIVLLAFLAYALFH